MDYSGREYVRKLYLSQRNKKLAGLCGGIGTLLNIDPMLVRLLAVFGALMSGILPLVLTYIVAWVIVPMAPDEEVYEEDI